VDDGCSEFESGVSSLFPTEVCISEFEVDVGCPEFESGVSALTPAECWISSAEG
jgi:hypothetical protein